MPLDYFHPLIREWFIHKFAGPTEVQDLAWKEIVRGSHVLVTAPTGSGKTLTAFLWALDRLITGAWETGRMRVLYISPLKALNNDIQANLLEPLAELREMSEARGLAFPDIRVMVRSGDTPDTERRRMLKKPPEILITTPESLNILLSSKRALPVLTDLKTVILDEIHAVAGSKRGVHLMTAVERLTLFSGEFQRIGISATVRPLDKVAEYMGGKEPKGPGNRVNRDVVVINVRGNKEYDVVIAAPQGNADGPEARRPEHSTQPQTMLPGSAAGDGFWEPYAEEFRKIIRDNRTTLFFVPSRRHAEKLAFLINRDEPSLLAYAHHGSLSRELRHYVEERLKSGDLPAIVATSSLELGIDIGHLDEVILVKTPWSVASALQRIGRAGHRVGEKSRARFYPAGGLDSLKAAVMFTAVLDRDIEETLPVREPLDVLAQVIVSMTGTAVWKLDELYDFLRTCYSFSDLTRRQFDLVIGMLAGKYASSTQKVLEPRLFVDSLTGTVKGKEGILALLYHSGGTIPDRGYFDLRMGKDGAKIGELDEEFVWERKLGDTFAMGTQLWTITEIGARDVKVIPGAPSPQIIPFWKAENQWSAFHFAEKLLSFCETWTGRLRSPDFLRHLSSECRMAPDAAEDLVGFLLNQEEHTGLHLPHRRHVVFEYLNEGAGFPDTRTAVLHTLWGGRINHPFGLLLASLWEERFGYALEVYADNECILFHLPHTVSEEILPRFVAEEMPLSPDEIAARLKSKLEGTEFFGARFRENAARALLLPRGGFGKRQPLWLTRLKSKKLFSAVKKYEDFPITVETWRTCLRDEFDIPSLALVIGELRRGQIKLSQCWTSSPSPFARNILWYRTNLYMYQTDEPFADGTSSLSDGILQDLMAQAGGELKIPRELSDQFAAKIQRTWEGYAPDSWEELVSFVERRVLVPYDEWLALLNALERDHGFVKDELVRQVSGRLVLVEWEPMAGPCVCHHDLAGALAKLFSRNTLKIEIRNIPDGEPVKVRNIPETLPDDGFQSREEVAAAWLSFYGVQPLVRLTEVLGVPDTEISGFAERLVREENCLFGNLLEDSAEISLCDPDNWERLLFLKRKRFRFSGAPHSPEKLCSFLLNWQEVREVVGATSGDWNTQSTSGKVPAGGAPGEGSLQGLENILELLSGYPAPARLWEENFLPCRLPGYTTSSLDTVMGRGDFFWFGVDRGAISFSPIMNIDMFLKSAAGDDQSLLPNDRGRYDLFGIMDYLGLSSGDTIKKLWEDCWKGQVTADSFLTVRQGIRSRFRPGTLEESRPQSSAVLPGRFSAHPGRRSFRSGFKTWKAGKDFAGHWFSLGPYRSSLPGEKDLLEGQELTKDRARQLLFRYGILFKELLARELPAMQWRMIFPVLRLMEFSGEAVSGRFFEGIRGVQFISREAVERYSSMERENAGGPIRWINAWDPASPCGLSLQGLTWDLPARLPANHLVFDGERLVLISQRMGRRLSFLTEPGAGNNSRYLDFFKVLLARDFNPPPKITAELINDVPVRESPYASCLLEAGFRQGYGAFTLYAGTKY